MASASFRDSMNGLGWARRDAEPSVNTSASNPLLSKISNLNPFNQRGHVQLPTHESPGAPLPAPSRREEEEAWFALSRWDRIMIFAGCNLAALACFVICFALFPVLSLRPRKFAILWSVGSVLFLSSWAFMMGPYQYAAHLISGPRLPFTATYFGAIVLTIFFAVGLRSTILTLFSAIVQLIALVWYLVSYFPLGSQGLMFAARVGGGRVAAWMNG